MASQADLFAPVMTPPKAPGHRTSPRLWVRRLSIFKALFANRIDMWQNGGNVGVSEPWRGMPFRIGRPKPTF